MADFDRTGVSDVSHSRAQRRALRAIAVFEAGKGIAALAAVVGLLDLMHHDVRHLAMELIGYFNLNPDARYPSILLHYADAFAGANVRSLLILAFGYIVVRTLEAYGLWNDQTWGEWLGAVSGGLYIPFEISNLMHRPSLINAAVLVGNILVVSFLIYQLARRSKHDITRR